MDRSDLKPLRRHAPHGHDFRGGVLIFLLFSDLRRPQIGQMENCEIRENGREESGFEPPRCWIFVASQKNAKKSDKKITD